MKSCRYTFFAYVLVLFCFLYPLASNAQFFYGTQQQFGKQRVVYNIFDWNFYRFPQYDIFFYKNGSRNAQYVAYNTRKELAELAKLFELQFEKRFNIIVFNSLTDLKQSNLNLEDDESYNTGGITRLNQNTIFLYGTGDRGELREQLRAGLTELLMQYIATGGGLRRNVNSVKSALPDWFTKGLYKYLAEGMTPEMHSKIKDGLITKRLRNFSAYNPEIAETLGFSIWYYLDHKYGEKVIANVVYMSYTLRNVEKGFEKVLGVKSDAIIEDWLNYYNTFYGKKTVDVELPELKNVVAKSKYSQKIYQFTLSSDKKKAAYAINEEGEFVIYEMDVESGKRKRLFKGGFKIPQNEDLSIPLLAWSPDGNSLAFVLEKDGDVYFYIRNFATEELYERPFSNLDKIVSMGYNYKGDKLVFSAVNDGFTDIYVYNLRTQSLENVTKDSYDDLEPSFLPGDKRIVFRSNRVNDTLRFTNEYRLGNKTHDLFIYNYENKSKILKRATNTPTLDEVRPQAVASNYVSYLLFENENEQNRYAFEIDSVVNFVDTIVHYRPRFDHFQVSKPPVSILSQTVSPNFNAFGDIVYHDSRYKLIYNQGIIDSIEKAQKRHFYPYADQNEKIGPQLVTPEGEVPATPKKLKRQPQYEIDIDNYIFEDKILKRYNAFTSALTDENFDFYNPDSVIGSEIILDRSKFNPFKRIYRNTFFSTEFKAQLDNSYENLEYQVFTGGPVFLNPGVNGLFEIQLKDKLENHVLTGAFRTNFQPLSGVSLAPNSEFMVSYENRKGRYNKKYTFYRRSQVGGTDLGTGLSERVKVATTHVKGRLSYPLNPVSQLAGEVGFRRDRTSFFARSETSLRIPDQFRDYAILRAYYTFDNTINFETNLYRGLRAKLFIEYYQGFQNSQQTMVNIGADARHYLRLHKNIIWANRGALGTSLGSQRLIYYLGGTDNEFSPRYNDEFLPSGEINWGFQTLMTNMRGFDQNVRHGTSFALWNSELRIPIFQYLSRRAIRWGFIRHFQVVPFFDAGSAWTGVFPWSEDNTINQRVIEEGNIRVRVNQQLDPFVYGYGVGLRTKLFGYFIRADWAWGHDTGRQLPRKFHISLNLDF